MDAGEAAMAVAAMAAAAAPKPQAEVASSQTTVRLHLWPMALRIPTSQLRLQRQQNKLVLHRHSSLRRGSATGRQSRRRYARRPCYFSISMPPFKQRDGWTADAFHTGLARENESVAASCSPLIRMGSVRL